MSGRLVDTVTFGPRRRRRDMAKRLAELDRLDRRDTYSPPGPVSSIDERLEWLKRDAALPPPVRPAPQPKPRRFGAFLTLLVFVAAVVGGVLLVRRSDSHHAPSATSPFVATGKNTSTATATSNATSNDRSNSAGTTARKSGSTDGPSPGVGERPARLLPAPVAPAGSGGYKLLKTDTGAPARYDPCRPIHYVIRDQNTPAGGDVAIRQAVAAVSKATGLRFIEDGTTTETPSMSRPAYLPARYGNRWAPVLIAWTNPTEIPNLKGDPAGLGGSWAYSTNAGKGSAYVSGHVYLDTAQLADLQANSHGDVTEKLVIEHELGHLVGLDHVNDPTQVMYPSSHGLSSYGAGDLRGLAIDGTGACHPEL